MSIKTEDNTAKLPYKKEGLDPFEDTPEMQKFVGALKMLEETLDEETGQLEEHSNPDFADIYIRKARGMRILSRTISTLTSIPDETIRQEAEKKLILLQKKLKRNSEILKMHLEAVRGLADTLREVHEHYETDGTYNPFLVNMRYTDG